MRRSLLFSGFICAGVFLLGLLLQNGAQQARLSQTGDLPGKRMLVNRLGLTDLAIWSEARYTRHPSQADLFTAFQEHPGGFDHFPAGSIIGPGTPQRNTTLSFQKKAQP